MTPTFHSFGTDPASHIFLNSVVSQVTNGVPPLDINSAEIPSTPGAPANLVLFIAFSISIGSGGSSLILYCGIIVNFRGSVSVTVCALTFLNRVVHTGKDSRPDT